MRTYRRFIGFFLLAACLPWFQAAAQSGGNPSLLQAFPKQVGLSEILELRPIAGHHFNYEAPHQCGETGGFTQKEEGLAICQLPEAGEHPLVIGVCDDEKTFCRLEKHRITVADSSSDPSGGPSLGPSGESGEAPDEDGIFDQFMKWVQGLFG